MSRLDLLLYFNNVVVAWLPSATLRSAFYRGIMKCDIAVNSYIARGLQLETRGGLSLGEDSVINSGCHLDARGRISIGKHVSISSGVVIITADHDVQSASFKGRQRPVEIDDYVFVGMKAIILPGVKLARGAVVGAGTVVTKDVTEGSIVAGNPAVVKGSRPLGAEYILNYKRQLI